MAKDSSDRGRRRRDDDRRSPTRKAESSRTAGAKHRRHRRERSGSVSSEDSDGSENFDTASQAKLLRTTHIPNDLVSEDILLEMDYRCLKVAGGYLIKGALSTGELRKILVRSHEFRKQVEKTEEPKMKDDLPKFVRAGNLAFEGELQRICQDAGVPQGIIRKIVQEHTTSQKSKSVHRQLADASSNNGLDIVAQLARITVAGPVSDRRKDTERGKRDAETESGRDKSTDEDDSDGKDGSSDAEASTLSRKSSLSEAEDASTIDIRHPSGRTRSTKMDMAVVEDDTNEVRQSVSETANPSRHSVPPQAPIVPFSSSVPSQAEKQALTVIQHDDMRHHDVLLLKTLNILQDGMLFARDQRGSGTLTHAQVLQDLRNQEAFLNEREAQRIEEVKRIKQEILDSVKERQEQEQRIREQVRKELEAEYYLVHKTESDKHIR